MIYLKRDVKIPFLIDNIKLNLCTFLLQHIMSKENIFDYNSSSYNSFLKDYRDHPENKRVIVLAGKFNENRKYSLTQFISDAQSDTKTVDLGDYIFPDEDLSISKLKEMFDGLDNSLSLVVFKNAEYLNGLYTGHSLSAVKYSTPQEKYFINKLKDFSGSVLLEFRSEDAPSTSLVRIADAVVGFKVPSSFLERIFFWITQIRLNGSNFVTKRPA